MKQEATVEEFTEAEDRAIKKTDDAADEIRRVARLFCDGNIGLHALVSAIDSFRQADSELARIVAIRVGHTRMVLLTPKGANHGWN